MRNDKTQYKGLYSCLRETIPEKGETIVPREDAMARLKEKLEQVRDHPSDSEVFCIYGDSGVGKTTFLQKTWEEFVISSECHIVRYDLEQGTAPYLILSGLKKGLEDSYSNDYVFPLFDMACSRCGEEEAKAIQTKKTTPDLSLANGLKAGAGAVAELTGLSEVTGSIQPLISFVRQRWKYRKWAELERKLRIMSGWDRKEAAKQLSVCFAEDLNHCLEVIKKPLIVIVDSWELLQEDQEEGCLTGIRTGLMKKLKGVLWIVAGRTLPEQQIFQLYSVENDAKELYGFDKKQTELYLSENLLHMAQDNPALIQAEDGRCLPTLLSLLTHAWSARELRKVIREKEKPEAASGYVSVLKKRLPSADRETPEMRRMAALPDLSEGKDITDLESLLKDWIYGGLNHSQKVIVEVMSVLGKWTDALLENVCIATERIDDSSIFRQEYTALFADSVWKTMLDQDDKLIIWRRSYQNVFAHIVDENERKDILEAALTECETGFRRALFEEKDYSMMLIMLELGLSSLRSGMYDENVFIHLLHQSWSFWLSVDSFTDQPVSNELGALIDCLEEKGYHAAPAILARLLSETLVLEKPFSSPDSELNTDPNVLTAKDLLDYAVERLKGSEAYVGDYCLALIQSLKYHAGEPDGYYERMKEAFAKRSAVMESGLPDEKEKLLKLQSYLMDAQNELEDHLEGLDETEIEQFYAEVFAQYAGELDDRPQPEALWKYVSVMKNSKIFKNNREMKKASEKGENVDRIEVDRLEKVCKIILEDPKYLESATMAAARHWEEGQEDWYYRSSAVFSVASLCGSFFEAKGSIKEFKEKYKEICEKDDD